MNKQAFGYIRVSGMSQIDGDGFPRQREAIQQYADTHQIEITKWFSDGGVSGTKETIDRPGLSDLFAELATTSVPLVIVERADRLARDVMVNELILRDLNKINVKVIDSNGVNLTANDNAQSKMIRQMLAVMAEYDKSATVAKLRAARNRKRAAGERCEGRKPFGTDPTRPDELPTVKVILSHRADKKSLRQIARSLNEANIPTRDNKQWQAQSVASVLKFHPQ